MTKQQIHGRSEHHHPKPQILVEKENDASKCRLHTDQPYLREAEASANVGDSSAHEAEKRDVAEDYVQCK